MSSDVSFSHRFSPWASSDRADIGSPWEPVEMMHTSPGRQVGDVLDVDERRVGDAEDAEVAGQAHVLAHRQPERGHLAAVGDGGVGDLLDAVDVAGEAGGDDPPPGLLGEHRVQHGADVALARRVPALLGVGGVGHQQPDALAAGDARRCGRGR